MPLPLPEVRLVVCHSGSSRKLERSAYNQRRAECDRAVAAIAAGGIVVDMIVQNLTCLACAELSFSVPSTDVDRAARLTRQIAQSIDPKIQVAAEPSIAKLFVLGVGMRTHTGVATRTFGALADRGINIALINTSEVRINVATDIGRGQEGLACLKRVFSLPEES